MRTAMRRATRNGDAPAIVRLVAEGESVNCVDASRQTPVIRVLIFRYGLNVVNSLVEMKADLTICDNIGANVVHAAARGGNVECIDRVLAITTFGVNSTSTNGWTPLMRALIKGRYDASVHLVEKGANLFAKNNNGIRAIETPVRDEPTVFLGPQVLDHFKNI
jgi:hypothetical protein